MCSGDNGFHFYEYISFIDIPCNKFTRVNVFSMIPHLGYQAINIQKKLVRIL